MKLRWFTFGVLFLLPFVIFAQWNEYSDADTTNLKLKKPHRINIRVFDITDKSILEKPNLLNLVSLINSNQLDSNLFSFVIHLRTGIHGAVCMDKESYIDKQGSVEVLGYNYPIILIDTSFMSKAIAKVINETCNPDEKKLLQPLKQTSVLYIDGRNAAIDYNFLITLLSDLQENNKPVTYYAHHISITASPFAQVFANVRLSDKGAALGRNYSLGVDYEYRGGALNPSAAKKKKLPWLGLGLGLHFSNSYITRNQQLINAYQDEAVDSDNQPYRLLVEAKNLNETINLKSIALPVFVSLSFLKNRNLNVKLGLNFSWLFGNVQSNGAFTYKGVYYLNTIYQDTLDDRYQGIAEKYGFYNDYPLTSSKKLKDTELFKQINCSLLAEINYNIRISEHVNFIIGLNSTMGLTDILQNNATDNYMVSTGINDYHSLLSGYDRIFLHTISLKAGLNFCF
jgi:hypothetical protein